MGHGCIIVGYDDRRQQMLFYNPWGNEFNKDYNDVAVHGYGIVVFDPPRIAPTASAAFVTQIQQRVPRFDGDFLTLANRLQRSEQSFELVWCSRRDSRNDKHFAVDTARHDGRKILELAFRRNPAVLIPPAPMGKPQNTILSHGLRKGRQLLSARNHRAGLERRSPQNTRQSHA